MDIRISQSPSIKHDRMANAFHPCRLTIFARAVLVKSEKHAGRPSASMSRIPGLPRPRAAAWAGLEIRHPGAVTLM